MKILDYFKDKLLFLAINFMIFTTVITAMVFMKNSLVVIFIIFCIWFLPLLSYMLIEAIEHKKYYNEINNVLESIEKKYLLPEVINEAKFIQGNMFNDILKDLSRDMHENIKYYRDMQTEYEEYIETWVHEIKTPIASSKLIIENNNNEVTKKLDFQLDKIDGFVEQVLYYARSNDVSKDYIIKKIKLNEIVMSVVKRNYRDFINKKIKLEMKDIDEVVYSDAKWLGFIINQIIGNSIKYCGNSNPTITIGAIKKANSIILTICDNGVGIVDKDINRIFEKGFTGENGRIFGKSTGMGLYLCNKLSLKLGLRIDIKSEVNVGTKVSLIFPLSNMGTMI